MKLIDLIEYLINPEELKVLYKNEKLSADSEGLLGYMQERLSLDSEIVFFKIEETEDDMIYAHGGVRYVQFFPIDYAVELVESDLALKGKGYTNLQIAERLLHYRIYDA